MGSQTSYKDYSALVYYSRVVYETDDSDSTEVHSTSTSVKGWDARDIFSNN